MDIYDTLRTKDKIEPQYYIYEAHAITIQRKLRNFFISIVYDSSITQTFSLCTNPVIYYRKTNKNKTACSLRELKKVETIVLFLKYAYMIFVLKFNFIRPLKVHNDIYSPTELELPFFLSFWRVVLFKSTTAGVVLDETCASFCPLLFLI